MLRSCFSSVRISADFPDTSVDYLVKGLQRCGVSPSYVSLTGDMSLIRSSGDFANTWELLFSGTFVQEDREGFVVTLNPPSFTSLDGKLPYSILLFQNNLHTLHVKNCSLDSLPETLGDHLCHLVVLDLSCNNLLNLPNSICSIATLSYLNVTHNSLISLPVDIGLIRDLETLIVSHNQIKILPSSIVNCSKLQVLDLQGNQQLQNIPLDLSLRLKNLHTLFL